MHPWLCIFIIFNTYLFPLFSKAEIGSAAYYTPPYTPTTCYGNNVSLFPTNNLFAAAGEGIWDNGAACGREYLVECISTAAHANSCDARQTIRVMIVERAQALKSVSRPSKKDATIVLSTTAYDTISNGWPPSVNVEFLRCY